LDEIEEEGRGRTVKASPEKRFAALIAESPVYAVTDDALPIEQLDSAVAAILDAGIRILQYRDKMRSDRERVEIAGRLGELVRAAGGLLIVDDRVDIAVAAGADGAHLGQDDLPVDLGRRILGPDLILGASASYLDEIEPERLPDVDYLGFGAIYSTDTKPDAEYAGLELFRDVCQRCRMPVIGIGGITAERVPEVMACGAAGVAVVSALFRADDPGHAARRLLAAARGTGESP
jgi:thiamine-phosphate diphosphorylase